MKITVLDANTLGSDLSIDCLKELGECTVYPATSPEAVAERIKDCDVAVLNKVRLNESNLCGNKSLKLICVCATGYDNIDVDYCKKCGIAVCNVEGYSSHSVAQTTIGIVLSLCTHLREYNDFVRSGAYSDSSVANRLTPVYHELWGKTWGILGFGNIGREVGEVAKALGCRLLVCKRKNIDGYNCVDIDTLCKESDIITIHTPLNDDTRNIINAQRLSLMKENVIIVNASRGAVTDEAAVAEAVKNGRIGAFGTDVYALEPFGTEHPFYAIKDLPNVFLTPHMAWGAYESRERCINEVALNIKDFLRGGNKGRVDIQ